MRKVIIDWFKRFFAPWPAPVEEQPVEVAPKQSEYYAHWLYVPRDIWRWPNFTPQELACKGLQEIIIDFDAIDKLQAFRTAVGVPFTPNSAYRSSWHNKRVGGSPTSLHMEGKAFDIPIKKGMSRAIIHREAKKAGFTGIGDYNTFVHVDTGKPRYWDLRT